MSLAVIPPAGPWTEEEYFALGESNERIELFDGTLLLSPTASLSHQRISRRLANALEAAASQQLWVEEAVNLRVGQNRILIPDVVVGTGRDDILVVDARDVRLVIEVVSPGNAANDRVLKMRAYAVAGIPWYLLVERDGADVVLQLYRLEDTHYVAEAVAKGDELLHLVEPIRIDISPAQLLER
jgi:Uma2 family endonuclease